MKLPDASDIQDKLENIELDNGWYFTLDEINRVLTAIKQVMEEQQSKCSHEFIEIPVIECAKCGMEKEVLTAYENPTKSKEIG